MGEELQTILVKFKDVTLGELTYENNFYYYRTFDDNVTKAKEMGYPISLFQLDESFVSGNLPSSLDDFIPNENAYIYKLANISNLDSNFEKLLKVAKLNLADTGLYISVK